MSDNTQEITALRQAVAAQTEVVSERFGSILARTATSFATYAAMVAAIPTFQAGTWIDIIVVADETNDGARTRYWFDGVNVNWVITLGI